MNRTKISPFIDRLLAWSLRYPVPIAIRYFVATGLIVAVGLFRLLVVTSLVPWLLFIPTVLIISLMLGRGPGLYSSVLAAFVAALSIARVDERFWLTEPQWAGTLLFVVVSAGVAVFIAELRAAFSRSTILVNKMTLLANENKRLVEDAQKANDELEERVSERTAMLEQTHEALRQAQKMEAVGQLTGGISHDFNNLLFGISGSLEIIELRLRQGQIDGLERFLEMAQSSTQRATALTQRLLAFSRRQTLDPQPTDVNRLVIGMEDLIRRTVGPEIQVIFLNAEELWPTKIDAAQLENTLLNLAINARDAMPEGGRLTIETASRRFVDADARGGDFAPGHYLSICVSDTGTGIPPVMVDRIFDPFFTTKPPGQGTGLGLSMVHGFVRQSGGQIRLYTKEGEGTSLCLYLPRYFGELGDDDVPSHDSSAQSGVGRSVLVIDDEESIRTLIIEVLNEAGYKTLEAENGTSGLKILGSDARIDLLITDVGLPGGMNGRQVADAARKVRPNLAVLFVTGYAEQAAIGAKRLSPDMEVLIKPFSMAALTDKVDGMLEISVELGIERV